MYNGIEPDSSKSMKIPELLEGANLSPTLLEDRTAYIQAIRRGISGEIVKQAVQVLEERELFIHLLNTNSANLSRFYRQKQLTKMQSEGILDTLRVFQNAITVFENEQLAKEWLHTRIPALAGEYPINLCDTFEGRKLVREALRAIEYGEFS
jgi:putative toxin-antitoxin system antitoxin component (TIGR02293 family)